MFGNSPFGFSGSGGGGGGGTIGGGGTLNYLCKFTPDGTTIGNSQLFDDGTFVGLGTITPAYGFQIGDDITQKTFFHYLGTNGNDATWFSQSISANIFRLNGDDSRILFNESGSTNWRTIFNGIGGDYPVTIRGTGSNPLYGTIQLGIQSSDSEVGLAFDNIGTSGRGYNIFSTNSGSVLGAGNFIIADSTAATYRLVINSIGNLGVGILSPTAKTHIVGVDSTTSNYTLKLDNSSSSPLLYVRNDGNIGIGFSNPTLARVQVENSVDDLKASWFSINQNTGASSGQQIYMDNGVQSFSSGILGVSTINWNSYGNPKDAFIRYGSADGTTGNINFISPITGLGGAYNFYAYKAVSGGIPTLSVKGNYVSVNMNVSSASANLHVTSDGNTSADYATKVDNSSSSPLLYVRNDGNVSLGTNVSASKLYVFGVDSTTLAVSVLEPVSNVTEVTTGNTVNTIDASNTNLETIPIPNNTVLLIESRISCRKTGGAGVGTLGEGNGYIRTVKAQNIGGVVTIGVVQSSFTSESIASFDATFVVSGTDVILQVTGANNDNVTWNSITKKYKVA